MLNLSFEAEMWVWSHGEAPASWRFVTLPIDVADALRSFAPGPKAAFGSVRVVATVGKTTWRTSAFPDKKTGSFFLPIKAEVRRAERLADGQVVALSLELEA